MAVEGPEPGGPSVLVVDDDLALLKALTDELARRGYRVRTASGFAIAQAQLGRGEVDILLTDLRLGGRDGLDLIRHVGETSPGTRTILMSAYATVRDYKAARGLGAVDVLAKPFTPEELEAVMRRAEAPEAKFQAAVDGLTLADLLQVLHHGRRSATVRVAHRGAVYVRAGEVIHAEAGESTGESALEVLLDHPGGVLSTDALEACPQTIDTPFQVLLLRAYTHIDERSAPAPEESTEASLGFLSDEVDLAFSEPPRSAADRAQLKPGTQPSVLTPVFAPPPVVAESDAAPSDRVVVLRKPIESTAPVPGEPVRSALPTVPAPAAAPPSEEPPRPVVALSPLAEPLEAPRRSRAPLVLLGLAVAGVILWSLLRPASEPPPPQAPPDASIGSSGALAPAAGGPTTAPETAPLEPAAAPASAPPDAGAPADAAPPTEVAAPATEAKKRPRRRRPPPDAPPPAAATTDARPTLGTVD